MASLIVGFSALILLIFLDKKKAPDKKLDRIRVSSSIILIAMVYTISICLLGHVIFKNKISEIISTGFGDDRFAWLLAGLLGEIISSDVSLYLNLQNLKKNQTI